MVLEYGIAVLASVYLPWYEYYVRTPSTRLLIHLRVPIITTSSRKNLKSISLYIFSTRVQGASVCCTPVRCVALTSLHHACANNCKQFGLRTAGMNNAPLFPPPRLGDGPGFSFCCQMCGLLALVVWGPVAVSPVTAIQAQTGAVAGRLRAHREEAHVLAAKTTGVILPKSDQGIPSQAEPTLPAAFPVPVPGYRSAVDSNPPTNRETTRALGHSAEERFVEAAESVDWAVTGSSNKDSEEYRFAINCDTEGGCKMRLAENKISCCMLCLDDTSFFGHDPYYGFYEFVEKDPWGPMQRKETVQQQQPDATSAVVSTPSQQLISDQPADANLDRPTVLNTRPKAAMPTGNPTLKAAAERQKDYPPPEASVMAKCKPPAEDDFKLPCCQFCPRSALSDDAAPFLVGSRFGGLLSNVGLPDAPCCAAPGSCCRWCPEYVCPYLQEYTVQTRLWWHICGSWSQDAFPKDWQQNTIGAFAHGSLCSQPAPLSTHSGVVCLPSPRAQVTARCAAGLRRAAND